MSDGKAVKVRLSHDERMRAAGKGMRDTLVTVANMNYVPLPNVVRTWDAALAGKGEKA